MLDPEQVKGDIQREDRLGCKGLVQHSIAQEGKAGHQYRNGIVMKYQSPSGVRTASSVTNMEGKN